MSASASSIADAATIAATADIEVEGENWVGALQNAAVKQGSPFPVYRFARDQGTPHQPVFSCTIELAGHTAKASGSSKQSAKRAAAKQWVDDLS